jgi:hypothetical protein
VDLYGGCLVDAATLQRYGDAALPPPPGPSLCSVLEAAPPKSHQLLSQYPDVVNPTGVLPPVKHSVEHVIETSGRPVSAKFRRLDPAKFAAAKEEFLRMEKDGTIRRSCSPWSSPLHMVPKKDNN